MYIHSQASTYVHMYICIKFSDKIMLVGVTDIEESVILTHIMLYF